jgi:hypothetical protein
MIKEEKLRERKLDADREKVAEFTDSNIIVPQQP